MMKWSITGHHVQGAAHRKSDVPCQDYMKVDFFQDLACVALCDGVSSARYSAEGAKFIASTACGWLLHQEQLFHMSAEDISTLLINHLLALLDEHGTTSYSCTAQDFASTLMFFVSDGQQFVAGNLGDGIFGSQDGQGSTHLLLGPEKGRFANESYFVTSPNSHLHLRLFRGAYDASNVYFLMTDGSADCLFDYQHRTFAPAINTYCDWCRRYNRVAVNKALYESMMRLFLKKTHDDCTLAFIAPDPFET